MDKFPLTHVDDKAEKLTELSAFEYVGAVAEMLTILFPCPDLSVQVLSKPPFEGVIVDRSAASNHTIQSSMSRG